MTPPFMMALIKAVVSSVIPSPTAPKSFTLEEAGSLGRGASPAAYPDIDINLLVADEVNMDKCRT